MKQQPLIIMPKKTRAPSVTAAGTRERRALARAWVAARGLRTWRDGDGSEHTWCTHCVAQTCREGAYLPRAGKADLAICLDCAAYPGAPARNWEFWTTAAERGASICTRCLRSLADPADGSILGGGIWARGGPWCWDCGSPDHAAREAWILELRTHPDAVPPWAGDRAAQR